MKCWRTSVCPHQGRARTLHNALIRRQPEIEETQTIHPERPPPAPHVPEVSSVCGRPAVTLQGVPINLCGRLASSSPRRTRAQRERFGFRSSARSFQIGRLLTFPAAVRVVQPWRGTRLLSGGPGPHQLPSGMPWRPRPTVAWSCHLPEARKWTTVFMGCAASGRSFQDRNSVLNFAVLEQNLAELNGS